jgi:hypothetical protein
MKNYKVSPFWRKVNNRPKNQGCAPEDAGIPPLDISRAFVSPNEKWQEAVKEFDCLLTRYLGAEDPREMVKLGDKLGLHSRYLKIRRRLLSSTYTEIDTDCDDVFPSGSIYGPNKEIDSTIVKQLREAFGGLALDKQIALMDLLMERELKLATAADDQVYFLVHTRRICIIGEIIDILLEKPKTN